MSLPIQMNVAPVGVSGSTISGPSVRASAKTVSIMPNNGSLFQSNTNNVIRIPLTSEGWLNGGESYLKMEIVNPYVVPVGGVVTDWAMSLDSGGASSIINRLRILSGPTVISDITNYNVLTNFLIQTQSSDDFLRMLSITSGIPNFNLASGTVVESISPVNANAGEQTAIRGLSTIAPASSITVAIPLISSILQCDKYIPLQFLANSLTIEIYLESNFYDAFMTTGVQAGVNMFQVQNVAYMANLITVLDDKVDAMMRSMLASNGMMIKTDDWTSSINSITGAGATRITNVIADRSQNLKSLVSVYKLPGTAICSGLNTYRLNTTGFQYKIGNTYYPNQKVNVSPTNLVEAFCEMNKCFNQNLFSLGVHTYCDQASFSNNGTLVLQQSQTGCFSMCCDLESFQNQTESGMNTSSLQTNIQLIIDTTASVVSTLITFAHKDSVVIIRPDGSVAISV